MAIKYPGGLLPRAIRSLPRRISIILEWVLIVLIVVALILITREWLRFMLLPVALVLFLRVADRVPVIGPLWRWLFGSRGLWDWLTLLFIPVALAVIGLQISSLFNAQRSDGEIEKTRFEAVERYLTRLADPHTIPVDQSQASTINTNTPADQDDVAARSGCMPSQPRGVTATSLTLAISNSLTYLKKSIPDRLIQKKIILEYLHSRGMITRYANVISLRNADMTRGNYYQARLPSACLNSIMFADSAASPDSASDFRFANLSNSNLSGANLARANLRNANLKEVVLNDYASLFKADLRGANLAGVVYDKNTNFRGAIFNTREIPLDNDRKSWLGSWLCSKRVRIVDTTRLCRDSSDYEVIPATRFPDDFYVNIVDRNTKQVTRRLLREKVSLLREINQLP